ncbi:MAG: hypothetical protein LLG04_00730 [Parachlamydia sp.]|nr:hypothetical protein [Parachlamydia sp.]
MALALGDWHLQQVRGRSFEESYATYQTAMRFFSSAIKIAQKQSPELYKDSHRAASRLLMHNEVTLDGITPLHVAVRQGHGAAVIGNCSA